MKRAALLVLLACRCTLIVDGLVDHADSGGSGGGSTGGGAAGGGSGGGGTGGGGGGSSNDAGTDGGTDGGTDAGIDAGTDAGIPHCGPTNPMMSCREVNRGYNGGYYRTMSFAASDDSLLLALPVGGTFSSIQLVRFSPRDGGLSTLSIDAGDVGDMNVAAEGTHWVLAWSEAAQVNTNVFCITDAAPTTNFQLANESIYDVSPAISASGNVLLTAGPDYGAQTYVYGRLGDGGCPTGIDKINVPHLSYGVAALHRPDSGDEGFELIDTGTDGAGSTVDVTAFVDDAGPTSYAYHTSNGAGLFNAALLSDGGFVLAVTEPGSFDTDPFIAEPAAGGAFAITSTSIFFGGFASNLSSCGPGGCIAVPYSLDDPMDPDYNDGVLSVAISHSPPPATTFNAYDVTCDAGVSGVASVYLGGKLYVAYSDLASVYVIYECDVPN